jgi:hypothetical protein
MSSADLLVDAFGRVQEAVHATVDGLAPELLGERVEASNSIAWLLWHLTRVQDDHVADAAGTEQVWTAGGWARRFDLPFDDDETGYAMSSEQVAQVRAPAELLAGYHDAVHDATVAYVTGLGDDDLARVVDTRWDPPVPLAVRLVSVVEDDLQHVGQAAFLRGIVERRSGR